MKKYKAVYAILNNKLEKLYVSHEIKREYELNGGELFEDIVLVCAMPGVKFPVNYLKRDKTCPFLIVCKSTVLL